MKYLKATATYLFGHLPKLAAIALPAAALFAFFIQPYGLGLIFPVEAVGEPLSFTDMLILVFGSDIYVRYPYVLVIGLAVLPLSLSYMVGVVEKHFRVGKFTLSRPLSDINVCFSPVFKIFALLTVAYLVFKLLLAALLALVAYIAGLAGAGAGALSTIMTVLALAAWVSFVVVAMPFMMASATMLVYGYSFKDAVGVAIKQTDGRRWQLSFALGVGAGLYALVTALAVVLGAEGWVYSLVLTALNAVAIPYAVVFALVAMFELSGIERRDRKKRYY